MTLLEGGSDAARYVGIVVTFMCTCVWVNTSVHITKKSRLERVLSAEAETLESS